MKALPPISLHENESKTDWERVKVMKDEEIDLTDSPQLDASFFKESVPCPVRKKVEGSIAY